MSALETVVAQAFRLRGKSRLSRTELTFTLAYELKWFTPEESKEIVDAALKQGLLKDEEGKLIPAFNIKGVEVPTGFKPDMNILKEKSLLDRIVELLGSAGIGREAALEMIEKKQKELGGMVTPETAALIIAKEKKLGIEPYIDEAYRQLLENRV